MRIYFFKKEVQFYHSAVSCGGGGGGGGDAKPDPGSGNSQVRHNNKLH